MPPTHKIRICVDNKKTVPEHAESHKQPRKLSGYISSLRTHGSTGQSCKADRDNKAAESISISFHERQLLSHFHGAKMRLTRDRESGCDKKRRSLHCCRGSARRICKSGCYSHSMVEGGFELMS